MTASVLVLTIGPAMAAALPSITARDDAPTTQLVAAPAPPATIRFAPAEEAPEATLPPATTAPTAPPATAPAKPAVRRAAQPAGDGAHDHNKPDTRPKPKPAGVPLGTPFIGKHDGPLIEGYARYEPQTGCDPSAKQGTLFLRDLLLARYPVTASLGIGRGCDVGGTSEHKEGRAFDWGANVANGAQRAAVDDFLRALFATDQHGNKHSLARRMGIMYVIWNNQIWGAYNADAGWRPYSGDSPHTDHVHISMSWAGARGETSYWSGNVVLGLPDGTRTTTTRAPRLRPSTTTSTRPPRPTTSTTTRPSTTTTRVPATSSTTTSSTPPPS